MESSVDAPLLEPQLSTRPQAAVLLAGTAVAATLLVLHSPTPHHSAAHATSSGHSGSLATPALITRRTPAPLARSAPKHAWLTDRLPPPAPSALDPPFGPGLPLPVHDLQVAVGALLCSAATVLLTVLLIAVRRPPLAPWTVLAAGGRSIQRRAVPLDLEGGPTPANTFTRDHPFVGVVVGKERLGGPDATSETYHITIRTDGRAPCREGQCYGVIPPGTEVAADGTEKPHYPRLYTIATSRYGDTFDGQTTALCVKKVAWWDQQLGGMKKELCSHLLCDAAPGTELTMIGPTGGALLLDPDPNAIHICIATGTGIAPYRAFWRRMFYETVPAYPFAGQLWIFFGAPNAEELLYSSELADLQHTYPDQVRLITAYSEEEITAAGGKMFVQDKVAMHAGELFPLLKGGAHLYCSGSKLMMPGIQEALEREAHAQGLDWATILADLKERKRWHVEVY